MRFNVRDDISPHIILSLQRWKAKKGEGLKTVDGLNHIWFDTDKPWALPDELKTEDKRNEVLPHSLYAGEPARVFLFVFDNTRLARVAATATLSGPTNAKIGSFGFRSAQGLAQLTGELERTAFDPSTARTDVEKTLGNALSATRPIQFADRCSGYPW